MTTLHERAIIVSMTFPPDMLAKIDESRGDTSRSRYVRNMLQKAYRREDKKNVAD